MCEQCENPVKPKACGSRRRLKLWQLPRHLHCPIIGTCLTLGELRKVQRQTGLMLPPGSSDYQLHTCLVAQAEQSGPASQRINKLLERKYSRWVSAFGQLATDEERTRFWRQALRSGDLAGPFWALVSHTASGQSLCDRAQGDVHMLSHLQGASNRADLRHTAQLEQQLADLQQALEQAREDHQRKWARQEALLAAQSEALSSLRQQQRPASHSEQGLRRQLADSHKKYRLLAKRQEWSEQQLARRDRRISELEHGQAGLVEQLRETQQECKILEQALEGLRSRKDAAIQTPTQTPTDTAIDLKGRRLAYVGGRASLYPRLRALVEAHNGHFSHHDGGLEDSRAELCSRIADADLVFCPVDCISHDACLRVKRFCKQHDKGFMPLRTASLSAFTRGLRWVEGVEGEGEKVSPLRFKAPG